METRRAKQQQQQQQQKVLEKQSPWVLATPAMPITPEERPRTSKCFLSSDDHARDVKSRDTATSSRPNEVQYHNVGSHRSTLVNPTTGFPQIYIGNVLVLTDPVEIQNVASFSPSVFASVVGSKDQTLSLLNGKLLPSGNFCHGGNHPHNGIAVGYHPNLNFDPEEAACTSTADTVPTFFMTYQIDHSIFFLSCG